MFEKFNPSDSKYKKVEDLPKKERGNFVDVSGADGGGFVRKEAAQVYDMAKVVTASERLKGVSMETRDLLYEMATAEEKGEMLNLLLGEIHENRNSPEFDKEKKDIIEQLGNVKGLKQWESGSPAKLFYELPPHFRTDTDVLLKVGETDPYGTERIFIHTPYLLDVLRATLGADEIKEFLVRYLETKSRIPSYAFWGFVDECGMRDELMEVAKKKNFPNVELHTHTTEDGKTREYYEELAD